MSGELDEGPDDDVVDSQGELSSEAAGEHSGGLPRHTGPPPEEIPGFDVDPELENLLNRDVMELDEEIRQDVQLYRSRKMQAVRDSDLGKTDGEITSTEEEDEEEAAPASGTTGDEVEDGEKGGSSLLPDWAWPG